MFRILVVSILLVWANLPASRSQSYSSCPTAAPLPKNLRVLAYVGGQLDFFTPGPPASGFLVDLLNAITTQAGLTYTLSASPSGFTAGTQNPNGSFDGSLVGQLVNNQTDLALGMLTISSQRESVVDFLEPFGTYNLQIVYNTQFGLTSATQYISQNNANLAFIQNSPDAALKAIASNIAYGKASDMPTTNDGGLAKVLTGNFAYVIESPLGTRFAAANPGKVTVSALTSQRFFYALAVQQGSGLREVLNIALLKLEENGTVQSWLNKYNLNN